MPNNSFLSVFAKSPIKPMEEHIDTVFQTTEQLLPFFEAVFAADWTKATAVRNQISDFERKADVIKREIRVNLPRGLFMPVERTDLLELVSQQDRIANKAKDIAGLVIGRELAIPAAMQTQFMAYVQRCLDAVAMARTAINELDELLETGFRGREVKLVERMLSQLDEIEHDTDDMQVTLRIALRKAEASLNPIDVMFLYKTLEWVGDLADGADRVGARLEILLAR